MKTSKYTYIGKSNKLFTNGECYAFAVTENNKYTTKTNRNYNLRLDEDFLSDNFTLFTSKPVYTQEMHEAGELPSVGMECLTKYKHQDDTMWLSCFIVGLNKDGDYLVFEHTIRGLDQHHIKDGVYDFKPLTPPVKLVDGKAYLVTHKGNGHEYEVLYRKGTDSFFSSKIDHPSRFFTNIQPLTVEK